MIEQHRICGYLFIFLILCVVLECYTLHQIDAFLLLKDQEGSMINPLTSPNLKDKRECQAELRFEIIFHAHLSSSVLKDSQCLTPNPPQFLIYKGCRSGDQIYSLLFHFTIPKEIAPNLYNFLDYYFRSFVEGEIEEWGGIQN